MSKTVITTARLIPYTKRPKQAAHFTTAFTYDAPAGSDKSRLGSMLIVIEVLSSGRVAEEVAELIIETAGNQYFNIPADPDRPILDHLEHAIKGVNGELSRFIDKGNTSWLGKISAVVAVIAGSELHLTQTGAAEAYLYRGRKSIRITEGAVRQSPQPHKIFGSIASGSVAPEDKLLLATPALFHAISLLKLKQIIIDNHPSLTVGKLKDELGKEGIERVAAIATEVTTPEAAALRTRPQLPDEVQVLPPEHPIETARAVAAPIAQSAVTSGQRLGRAASTNYRSARPRLEAARRKSVDSLRAAAGSKRAAGVAAGSLVVILLFGFILLSQAQSRAELARLESLYAGYSQQVHKAGQMASSDRTAAIAALTKVQSDLEKLQEEKRIDELDKRLKEKPSGRASSVKGLAGLVAKQLDILQGVERVSTTTLLSRQSFAEGLPTRIVPYGKKLLLAAAGDRPHVYTVNPETREVTSSKADFSALGTVTSLSPASSSGAVLLTTKAGSIWVYAASDDTLEELTIGPNHLSKARAVASYNSNLYVLAEGKIYKHLRIFGGYGPEIPYTDGDPAGIVGAATSLSIDGSVYAAGPRGMAEIIAGAVKTSQTLPEAMQAPSVIRSLEDGTSLVLTDAKSGRIGLLERTGTGFETSRQFILGGAGKVADGMISSAGAQGYALADGQLLSFPTKE